MGLTFLAPLFLAGALAVAIPVLIHLSHRERKEAVRFPSLMFLRRVPYKTVRRQRIRHWLLFLLRTAAILLLVSAFARPFVDRASLGPAVIGQGREVVVLLDQSASMGYADRWDRATDAARAAIDGLGPGDRATLVLFSDRAEAMTQATADAAVLRAAVDDARPMATATHYAPALQLAHDVLDATELPNRTLVLITDFQRAGWTPDAALRMPEGTVVTSVDLSDSIPRNVAVTGMLLDRIGGAGGDRLAVSARVVNLSSDSVPELPVTLAVEDLAPETHRVTIAAGEAVSVGFAPVPLPNRTVRAQVSLDDDDLPADDEFRFTVAPRAPVPVLLVHHPAATPRELLYLSEALRIGTDPAFDVVTRRVTELRADDVESRALVILDDVPFPQGAAGRRLREFVRAGGGLLVILGPRSGTGAWAPEAAGLLGAAPGPIVDREGLRGGTLSVLDYRHPVFAAFATTRGADFTSARFYRYRRWTPPDSAVVLARFDDGAPALAEVPAGAGRALVWTADAANVWSDLPVQPVFLPFAHELARYAASYRPVPAWRTAGLMLDLAHDLTARSWGPAAAVFGPDPGELVVDPPSGKRFAVGDSSGHRLELRDHGFYQVRRLDGSAVVTIAVNTEPAESDLTRVDPEAALAAITPTSAGSSRVAALSAALSTSEKERRQALWWYVLAAALIVLVTETVVAGRLSGAGLRQRRSGGT
jgi:hypothetical protein